MTYIKYKSSGNSSRSALGKVIDYCLQPYKTQVGENVFCTSGVDCVPAYALDQFMATKQAWGKCAGTFFYHYVQSFSPDEPVTPEEANAIGLEFASRAWPGHEVLVTTHVDRAHLHNHFVINSVNHETGMKLRQSPKTLLELRSLSDEICSAHGLSVLKPYAQKPGVRDVKNGEYRAAVRSGSWKFRLRNTIKDCMEMCWTPEQFRDRMREYGYETVWRADRKHIVYTCLNEPPNKDGKPKKCRDRNLSDTKYLKEAMENEFAIRKRILEAAEHGRADGVERAEDSPFSITGRAARADGFDEHGDDEYAAGAVTADRGAEITSGSMAGEPVTGWEKERGTLMGKGVQRPESGGDEEQQAIRDDESERILADARMRWPEYLDTLCSLFPRPSLKGKTREEVERKIDAEIEAKNVGAAMGIPLTVVMLLIQKAKADELDDARDVFAHARPAGTPAPAESDEYDDDDGEADDLDEDDESDYDYDDDGEEVYDEEDDFDPKYDPDDEQDDNPDDYNNSCFSMKLT